MKTVCVVIPCYNEEFRLKDEFLNFLDKNQNITFCFVNDGSTDRTIEILNRMQGQNSPQVLVIDSNKNQGKAEAIRLGMLTIFKNYNFDYIGYFDADLATPLSMILILENELNNSNYKIAIGSRLKRLGAEVNRSKYRHFFGRIFATIADNILKLGVYDTQCGAKLIEYNIAKTIFEAPFISKWLFDIELIARILDNYQDGAKMIVEVPVNKWTEIAGSKIKFSEIFCFPYELLKIKNCYLKKK